MTRYRIISNRNRKEKLGPYRRLIGLAVAEIPDQPREPWQALLKRVTGIDVLRCRHCKVGTMVLKIQLVPYARDGPIEEMGRGYVQHDCMRNSHPEKVSLA